MFELHARMIPAAIYVNYFIEGRFYIRSILDWPGRFKKVHVTVFDL